jgi:hypothetical protein
MARARERGPVTRQDAEDTALVAAVLRGEMSSLSLLGSDAGSTAFLDVAARHDVEPLVRRALKEHGSWPRVPVAVRAALDARARHEAALEALRSRETRRVLDSLEQGGVTALVLKGAALAHTHYPAPYLRPRGDTDLLVRLDDRARAADALGDLGYRRERSVLRDSVHTQWMFRRHEGRVPHTIDLHWAISNRPLFATTLSFEEVRRDARPVAPLGAGALAPAPVHALILACVHRVAHHDDAPNLIWLHDIKLLAESLSPREWGVFWQLAVERRIAALCREGLALTARQLRLSEETARASAPPGPRAPGDEPSVAYLGGAGARWRSLLLDVRDAAGAGARLRLLAGLAFPHPAYMRSAYGATGPATLTAAYLRRAAGGLWRLLT